ncbi:DUF2851 family protein [Parafilimonas sp.]|uniref:DUF2851 family protein n=1 Tax=Parafilimonas sp. TaxID=1969739 RepID=UPI0039E32CC9
MNERLLQFIWQFRYFNQSALQTSEGRSLKLIHPGHLNKNAGPDFMEARIKVDNTLWVGNVELHVCASHWRRHNHSADKNYSNIILHVVWLNDEKIFDAYHQPLATLELQPLVSKITLQRFEQLMQNADEIACSSSLPVLSEIAWLGWKERLVTERLQQKSNTIMQWLADANNNWEEVFWISLCRSFGMKVNADIFEQVATSLPVNLLAKHKSQIHQLEALLLGQAGLLNGGFEDAYPVMLKKEYSFLSRKYNLQPVNKAPAFLRMRPFNFPTLRLAQLAMLIYQSSHLFSKIKTAVKLHDIFRWFDVTANDFWHYHYTLKDEAVYIKKTVGNAFIHHIIINTIVPVMFLYAINKNDTARREKSLNWLMELEPEQNAVTRQWKLHGVTNQNALHSQALLHLKNMYCTKKKCLDCAVGVKLLRGE